MAWFWSNKKKDIWSGGHFDFFRSMTVHFLGKKWWIALSWTCFFKNNISRYPWIFSRKCIRLIKINSKFTWDFHFLGISLGQQFSSTKNGWTWVHQGISMGIFACWDGCGPNVKMTMLLIHRILRLKRMKWLFDVNCTLRLKKRICVYLRTHSQQIQPIAPLTRFQCGCGKFWQNKDLNQTERPHCQGFGYMRNTMNTKRKRLLEIRQYSKKFQTGNLLWAIS